MSPLKSVQIFQSLKNVQIRMMLTPSIAAIFHTRVCFIFSFILWLRLSRHIRPCTQSFNSNTDWLLYRKQMQKNLNLEHLPGFYNFPLVTNQLSFLFPLMSMWIQIKWKNRDKLLVSMLHGICVYMIK